MVGKLTDFDAEDLRSQNLHLPIQQIVVSLLQKLRLYLTGRIGWAEVMVQCLFQFLYVQFPDAVDKIFLIHIMSVDWMNDCDAKVVVACVKSWDRLHLFFTVYVFLTSFLFLIGFVTTALYNK